MDSSETGKDFALESASFKKKDGIDTEAATDREEAVATAEGQSERRIEYRQLSNVIVEAFNDILRLHPDYQDTAATYTFSTRSSAMDRREDLHADSRNQEVGIVSHTMKMQSFVAGNINHLDKSKSEINMVDASDAKMHVNDTMSPTKVQEDDNDAPPPPPLSSIHLYAAPSIVKAVRDGREFSAKERVYRKTRKAPAYSPEEEAEIDAELKATGKQTNLLSVLDTHQLWPSNSLLSSDLFQPPPVPTNLSFQTENPYIYSNWMNYYADAAKHQPIPAEFQCLSSPKLGEVTSVHTASQVNEGDTLINIQHSSYPVEQPYKHLDAYGTQEDQRNAFSSLLLAWYYSGYYTGRHSVFQEMQGKQ